MERKLIASGRQKVGNIEDVKTTSRTGGTKQKSVRLENHCEINIKANIVNSI